MTDLAIADTDDIVATIAAPDLLLALEIAAEQLDVKHDEDAEPYGVPSAADAHDLRDRLLAVLAALR